MDMVMIPRYRKSQLCTYIIASLDRAMSFKQNYSKHDNSPKYEQEKYSKRHSLYLWGSSIRLDLSDGFKF